MARPSRGLLTAQLPLRFPVEAGVSPWKSTPTLTRPSVRRPLRFCPKQRIAAGAGYCGTARVEWLHDEFVGEPAALLRQDRRGHPRAPGAGQGREPALEGGGERGARRHR